MPSKSILARDAAADRLGRPAAGGRSRRTPVVPAGTHRRARHRQCRPPAVDAAGEHATRPQTVVLAGGCFWGVQAVFQHVKGVTQAVSGYAGGAKDTAHYEVVSSGTHRPRRVGAGHVRSAADLVRPHPADLLLGGARSDPAQPPGPGRRHAVSLGDLLREPRAAAEGRAGLYRAARQGGHVQAADRDQLTQLNAFYPAEALSPGLRHAAPGESVHLLQRPAEGREPQELFPERLSREPVLVRRRAPAATGDDRLDSLNQAQPELGAAIVGVAAACGKSPR